VRQEHHPTLVTSGGYEWCTRTRRWKVRFESPAAAWDMADRVYEEDGDVVFVYQCLGYRTLRVRDGKLTRRSFLGCQGYHLTKQPRPMIGSFGIAHCWLGDSEAANLERYAGRRCVLPKLFMPPAPPRNEHSERT
jgi:hypothetical protein